MSAQWWERAVPVTRAARCHLQRGQPGLGPAPEVMWTLPIAPSTLCRGLDQLHPPQQLPRPPPHARELRQQTESPPERPGDQTHSAPLLPLASPGPLPPRSLRKEQLLLSTRTLGQATGFLLSQRALSDTRVDGSGSGRRGLGSASRAHVCALPPRPCLLGCWPPVKEPHAACCFRLFSWGTYAKTSPTGAGSARSTHELRAGEEAREENQA